MINDKIASDICNNLLNNISKIYNKDNSLKFFRKDFNSRTVWLSILKAHFENQKINIEQLARLMAKTSTISKPTLRLILDNAEHKGFLKFVKSKEDQRSVNIELTQVTINEFKEWCIERSKWFKVSGFQ
jgi:DNA-binding MarR family transcriptional regulator